MGLGSGQSNDWLYYDYPFRPLHRKLLVISHTIGLPIQATKSPPPIIAVYDRLSLLVILTSLSIILPTHPLYRHL
mgnify:CR=1 FL=1